MGVDGEAHLAVAFSNGAVAAVALSETCDALLVPLDAPSWLPAKGQARLVRSCGGYVVAAFSSGAIHAWDVSGDAAGRHCHWVLSEALAASALHFLEVNVPDKFALGKSSSDRSKAPGKGLRALTGSALREISLWDLARGQVRSFSSFVCVLLFAHLFFVCSILLIASGSSSGPTLRGGGLRRCSCAASAPSRRTEASAAAGW